MTFFMLEWQVTDIAQTVAWYQQVFGWHVAMHDPETAFALLTDGSFRLALKAGQPQPGSITPVFNVTDLQATLQHLAALGVQTEGEMKSSAEGYRRAFIRDPNGYRLGIFEWTKQEERSR